jgi:hypothetical protein
MQRLLFTIFTFFIVVCCFAQKKEIPRDTSFTVYGTWMKEKKYRPYIEIAAPAKPGNVLLKENVVYKTINERSLVLDIFILRK